MIIWGTPVSTLQFFGYSIALSGLLYYKLGADQLKGYANQGLHAWSEFGVQRPALRKVAIFGLVLCTIFILLGGLAPTYAPQSTDALRNLLGGGKSSLGSRGRAN